MPDDFDLGQIKFDEPKLVDPSPANSPAKKAAAKKVGSPLGSRSSGPGPGRPTKNSRINEMAEELVGFMAVLAIPLKMRDTHDDGSSCADVFLSPDSMEPTAELKDFAYKFATVGVDNKYISKFFAMGDDAGKWIMLMMSAQSLVMPIVMSHTRIGGGHENGGESLVA